jgi:DNA-binding GntR family transcriptional regulator
VSGRPKGGEGYAPGALADAVSVCLYRNGEGLSVAEIARKTGGHPVSVRIALQRLEKAGQVHKLGNYRARWTVKL